MWGILSTMFDWLIYGVRGVMGLLSITSTIAIVGAAMSLNFSQLDIRYCNKK